MMPVRLSGSTAETRTSSPVLGDLRTAAEGFDGLGAGVLLAVEAGDEAAAADGALRFHAAEAAQDLAPGNADVLGADEVAEDDAVAEEELLGPGFGELFGAELGVVGVEPFGPPRRIRMSGGGGQERPAAGGDAADGEGAEESGALRAAEAALFGGCHEGAEGLEAIGGSEAAGDEVPEAALNIARQAAGGGDDVVVEERTFGGEQVVDLATCASGWRERSFGSLRMSGGQWLHGVPADAGDEPRQVAAAGQRDGSGGGGGGGAAAVALTAREARPGDVAGDAELVQPEALVAGDAGGQDVALPGDGRNVVALQLGDRFEEAALALQLRAGARCCQRRRKRTRPARRTRCAIRFKRAQSGDGSSARRAARRRRAGRGVPRRGRARSHRGRGVPSSRALSGRPRRSATARVRRSSSGASSRKGIGPAVQDLVRQRRGLGGVDEVGRTRPASSASSKATSPSTSIASCRQSYIVWRTIG